jgi:crotonobetainyl-CoA:carnitine CoA-transferase CaiB-like acyl-CoA transferase
MTAPQALAHVRVVDLTHHVAGPYCTMMMAGFGAEVIKVERPGVGDAVRHIGPFFGPGPDPEASIPFLWLNAGKKCVTLNLKDRRGRTLLEDLVRRADVVVESFSPGVMSRLGLDYETLRAIRPGLVMTSISNFGRTGPYRDFKAEENVASALAGLMRLTGDPDKAPLQPGPALAQYTAGMHAYIATLMAVYQAGATGSGQHADVSIQESALENIEIALMEHLRLGRVAARRGDEHVLVPWQLHPCRDGYAAVIGGPVRHWLRAAVLFEEPRLLEEPLRHMAGRMARREEVRGLIQPWLERHDKRDVYHAGQARRLAFGYLAALDEVLDAPQHRARDFFVEVEHPVVGRYRSCGPPFRPSETPWRSQRAPLLGEHNEPIYHELLGRGRDELAALGREGVI